MEYVKKLENLTTAQKTFKNKICKHKLDQLGLIENVNLYTQPILDEQQKTRVAIKNLKEHAVPNVEPLPKKQLEFEDTFSVDFRDIDQNLPKSMRPVFNQDGFKIGKFYIDVNRREQLMQVRGKHNTYHITQDLIDLIKGKPLDNYLGTAVDDYRSLLQDVEASTKANRFRHLSGTPVKTGQGLSFLPDNIDELKARLEKLIVAAKEGHTNVYNEGMAILKRLLEKGAITTAKFRLLSSLLEPFMSS